LVIHGGHLHLRFPPTGVHNDTGPLNAEDHQY
jgi:hypothetical protein